MPTIYLLRKSKKIITNFHLKIYFYSCENLYSRENRKVYCMGICFCLLEITSVFGFCSDWFRFPFDAWDRVSYLIVALLDPFKNTTKNC